MRKKRLVAKVRWATGKGAEKAPEGRKGGISWSEQGGHEVERKAQG